MVESEFNFLAWDLWVQAQYTCGERGIHEEGRSPLRGEGSARVTPSRREARGGRENLKKNSSYPFFISRRPGKTPYYPEGAAECGKGGGA